MKDKLEQCPMKLEEAIAYADKVAKANESLVSDYDLDKKRAEIYNQIAVYLRELQEKRKEDSCEGCVNESGKANSLVCYTCRRHWHYVDLYEERRTNDQTDKGPSR